MTEELVRQGKGIVKSFSTVKGYGFISCEDHLDLDIYVHYSQVIMEGKKELKVGQKVEFLYKQFEEQGLRAYQVKVITEEE
jgi:CspA family cold shock protein